MPWFALLFLLVASQAGTAASLPEAITAESPAPDRDEFVQLFEAGPTVAAGSIAPNRARYLAPFIEREQTILDKPEVATREKLPEPVPAPEPSTTATTVVITSKPKPAAPAPAAGGWVPPGFEELLEPQTTVVDVYYGGAYLVSTTATFTPTDIYFLAPDAIVSRIPDLLEADQIAAILGIEMPTNSELVCLNQRNPACGTIETERVDVIFDEGQFRADLFINPSLLSVRSAVASRFLPPSTADWSLLNTASLTVGGAEGESTNYNLGNSTTVAWRESRLLGISNLTSSEDLTFDTLALQREYRGQQLQGGIFRSTPDNNLVFLTQADFQGISIASSLDTRQDLNQSAGNDLQIFLDSRSRVDILKDGRLVSTAVYDTGNQILDTSLLPGGAYEVVLRIRDAFGTTREETRFYVKTNRLPPRDQPLYFFEAGETVDKVENEVLPEGTGERFVRAGYAKRLSDNFGGEVGVLCDQDETLLETGLFRLGRSYELRLNGAVGSGSSRGASLNARTRIGVASFNTTIRQTWSDSADAIIGAETTQASINLTMPIGRSSMNLTGRYNDRPSGIERNIGLRYDFATRRFGQSLFTANLQITRNNGNVQVLLGGRLSIRTGRWQTQVAARAFEDRPENGESQGGLITDVSSIWQDGDLYTSDVNFILRANDGQVDRTLETELDVTAGLGRANVELVYSDDAERLSYGGNFFTSFIANANTLAIGARQQGQSAVVLDIKGKEKDAFFNVEVNGMRRGTARIGDKTVIGLPPFDTYSIRLKPAGDAIVDFEERPKVATLYPGNVVTMNWSVARVIVAFGQIVRPDGSPVANGVIDGVIGLATTDDFGLFQAEFNSDLDTLRVRTRTEECEVALPEYDASQLVVMLNELICR